MQTPNINKDYIVEMGNTEFVSMTSTKFLGIVLDDAINFKCHSLNCVENKTLLYFYCVVPDLF